MKLTERQWKTLHEDVRRVRKQHYKVRAMFSDNDGVAHSGVACSGVHGIGIGSWPCEVRQWAERALRIAKQYE